MWGRTVSLGGWGGAGALVWPVGQGGVVGQGAESWGGVWSWARLLSHLVAHEANVCEREPCEDGLIVLTAMLFERA